MTTPEPRIVRKLEDDRIATGLLAEADRMTRQQSHILGFIDGIRYAAASVAAGEL